MAIRFLSTPIFAALFLIISLFPFINSLSTVAISETGNQTVVCAVTYSANPNQQSLNCTIFPQRTQFFPLNFPSLPSISSVVAGNGFICALSSSYPSSTSIMVCWRFSNSGNNLSYRRIYNGTLLKDLNSGNSHICGLVNGTNSLQCWQWRDFNYTGVNNFSSSLAVGDNFVCGLSDSGQARCFGSIDYNMTDGMPVMVEAGFHHACAILLNGSLGCWGNMSGQRPDGEFKSLALGENRSCAIRNGNGTVICWGENGFGLPGSLRDVSFVTLEAKRTIFCGVLTSNLSLFCWGNENFDSNPLVFNSVVPGPCRPRNECASHNYLPNYDGFCDQGLVICQPRDNFPDSTNLPPPASSPPPLAAPTPPQPPPPTPPTGDGKKLNRIMVAVLVVGCIGTFSSLLVVCVFLFSRYIKIRGSRIHDSGRLEEGGAGSGSGRPNSPTDLPQTHPTPPVLEKKFSHLISMGSGGHLEEFPLEILLKATGNFSDEQKIGFGSFGSVYYATLDDGRRVAVKRAESSSSSSYAGPTKRGEENKDLAFMNELEFLSKLNHKNLVRLLGFCEDSDERVLVYEYMENGTLFDHLHKLPNSPLFSWAARITVALDAARGIEYLHEYANPHIIHRDIKSSNILLDDAWMAKVSDFGLSLMGPRDGVSHLSLRAAGTMGYMDPEYYRLQVLTTKSDVYSFGIVLLELLSGCKAIHKNENGVPRNVVDYVVPYIVQDEVHRVLDRKCPPPTPFEIEAVAYVGYLAADCVALEGRDRPTMSEVVDSLDRALGACLAPPVLSRSTTTSST